MDDIVLFKARVSSVSSGETYDKETKTSTPDFRSFVSTIRFTEVGKKLGECYQYVTKKGKPERSVIGLYVPEKLGIGEEYELVLRMVNKPLPTEIQANHRAIQDPE